MPTILVSGASRGIGRELVRQCLERGDDVVAIVRRAASAADLRAEFGSRPVILECDVTDDVALRDARRSLEGRVAAVDVLVNSAGRYSLISDNWDPGRTTFDALTHDELRQIFDVNAAGPMLVIRAFLDLLRRSPRPRILNLSSLLGSVSDRTRPGDYAYAASKAALNIMTRVFAAEFRPQGIIAVAVTPGWVHTDMGGTGASLSPQESVRGLLALADSLTLADSGRFVDYQGETQPW
jgi:NAD(P)-dependent dehydrogenase (short-subunit alcohol dehydrogenase family)